LKAFRWAVKLKPQLKIACQAGTGTKVHSRKTTMYCPTVLDI